MLPGDFTGHLGLIGMQSLDKSVNLVLELSEKFDMIILNGDPICSGKITWSRGTQKSSIDFYL